MATQVGRPWDRRGPCLYRRYDGNPWRGQTASPWGAQVPQTLAATTAERPMLLAS